MGKKKHPRPKGRSYLGGGEGGGAGGEQEKGPYLSFQKTVKITHRKALSDFW